MRDPRNNYHTLPIAQNEILVHIRINYSKLVEVVLRGLVRHVCTIYGQSEQATRVVNYILENPSFLVPTMRHGLGLKKLTIYHILNDLWPWVKKTDKTVEPPNPSTRGPHPHVWIVDGENLVEGVNEARMSYYDTLKQHDPALKHIEGLKLISARIAHQIWDGGIKYARARRYARGEISKDEYEEIHRNLQ